MNRTQRAMISTRQAADAAEPQDEADSQDEAESQDETASQSVQSAPAPGIASAPAARASMQALSAALRRERRRADLSLSEVARRADLSKSTLSQLESGIGNPSLETLWALCTALGIPFGQLFDPPPPRIQVIRAGSGAAVAAEQADYGVLLLATCPPGARRDVYRVEAEPGSVRRSDPHAPGVVEHVVVCAGRASVGVAEEPVELGPGDYIVYPGDVPHVFEALEPGTWAVTVSEHV